jgi:phospholipase A1
MIRIFFILLFSLLSCILQAQTDDILKDLDKDKTLKWIETQQSFGMYKNNYLITGIPLNENISRYTADIKFQISVSQRLTKTVLPFNTYLMLIYTQKSFWNIYAKSSPFKDNNYNPGLAFVRPVIRNNQLQGMGMFSVEHESNGKEEGDEDRSWNYFVLSGLYLLKPNFSVQAKIWAGWVGEQNKDLYKYRGYGLIALNYNVNDKLWISAVINPRSKFGRFNTQLEISMKLSSKANQYLFAQWYDGYGDSLLFYNQYSSMFRAGVCFKTPFRNLY